ncbi:hypothetical protein CDL15_Pgr026480 [Punica granatum]|uniref:Uncharacterized protein n=1 Tax=Punica granatum TaxID=22663 RepID=A0A218X6E2_PUNGR|nr:hypothetical protein CDL15_Pgr026480 [Punica granatum]
MQELRHTLIPDHSGYIGAPPQRSSPSAQGIPQSKNPHRTAGASPAKAQLLNNKASYQQGATAPVTPELESLSTRHPAKQKPSSRGGGITSKSTVAQQQSQLSARRNRPSSNIGLQQISTLEAASAPHTYSTTALQRRLQATEAS